MPGRANRTVKRGGLYILNATRCPLFLRPLITPGLW